MNETKWLKRQDSRARTSGAVGEKMIKGSINYPGVVG